MKKLKIYAIAFVMLAGLGFVSCDHDNSDTLTGNELTGGLLNSATSAITYALGSSNTLEHTANISLFQGAVKTTSIDVYKKFTNVAGVSSENVFFKTLTFPVTEQMESLSYTFTYAELISGLSINGTPLPASDVTLSPGEFWTLSYVSKTSEGNEHLNTKVTKVNVACVSELAGNYSTSTLRVGTGATYTFAVETLDQVGDGQYNTTYVGQYYGAGQVPGSAGTVVLAGTPDAGFTFTDICNNLQLDTQNLGTFYSNEVRQSAAQRALSLRNPDTGVLTFYYSIFFTGNTVEREFVTTMTPLL